MKAWIATDVFGSKIYLEKPEFERGFWVGMEIPELCEFANGFLVEPGHCQPITLTAAPLGPAVRGGE